MYQIVPENERKYYTYDEIEYEFIGKWLYLTNAEYTKTKSLIRAIVAVVADEEADGLDEGIYNEFNKPEYTKLAVIDLTDSTPDITSVFWSADL